VSARAVVPARRKLMLIARATGAAIFANKTHFNASALPAIQFLVEAGAARRSARPNNKNFYQRTVWVIGLFERLAEHDQITHS
jgi:hypothetical protein